MLARGLGLPTHEHDLADHRAIVEQTVGFLHLLERELAGEPEWIKASFVVGLKHLPVRYKIRPE